MFIVAIAWVFACADWLIRAASVRRQFRLKQPTTAIYMIGFVAHTFLIVAFLAFFNRGA